MKERERFNKAFKTFKQKISTMSSNEFWAMLGTSVEELREKQRFAELNFDSGMSLRIAVSHSRTATLPYQPKSGNITPTDKLLLEDFDNRKYAA